MARKKKSSNVAVACNHCVSPEQHCLNDFLKQCPITLDDQESRWLTEMNEYYHKHLSTDSPRMIRNGSYAGMLAYALDHVASIVMVCKQYYADRHCPESVKLCFEHAFVAAAYRSIHGV